MTVVNQLMIHAACRIHATISRPHVIGLAITECTQCLYPIEFHDQHSKQLIKDNPYIISKGGIWWPLLNSNFHIDGLVQDCSNSSALAAEFLQSCSKPSHALRYHLLLHCMQQHNILENIILKPICQWLELLFKIVMQNLSYQKCENLVYIIYTLPRDAT